MRIEQRIAVVEANHESDRDTVARHRVDPTAAELLLAQRVAQRVYHRAGRQPAFRQLPNLFQSDRELRRVRLVAQLQRADQLLGEIAAHAVGEDRDLGEDVGAGFEIGPLFAMPADSLVAGTHADDALAIRQHRLPREAGEDVDALRFDELGHPLHELGERDDVVAVIPERRRRDRQPERLLRREEVDVVLTHFALERRALRLKVGHEIAQGGGIEQRT